MAVSHTAPFHIGGETMKDIRVVELFAGVGGLRLGFEAASDRYKTVWANQWEPGKAVQYAADCYKSHFGENSLVNEDINTVLDQVPEHDLLTGGFPCQDYSVAHTGAKGIEGKKGVLWWSINDIIKLRKPKYVILENVDRLLKSPAKQRGRDFGIILRCLADEGYTVEWRVVNAADYGYQQRRRRTFIFAASPDTKTAKQMKKLPEFEGNEDKWINWLMKDGFFAQTFAVKDEHIKDKKPTYTTVEPYKDLVEVTDHFKAAFWNAGMMINGKIYSEELVPVEKEPITIGQLMETGKIDEHYFISGEQMPKWVYMKGAKKINRKSAEGFEYTFSEGPIAFPDPTDKPFRTMLTSEGSLNRSTHVIADKKTGMIRKLTPVECERADGFPDGWTATMPERWRYFTMGNALVVPLISDMGRTLNGIFDK